MTPNQRITVLSTGSEYTALMKGLLGKMPGNYQLDIRENRWGALLKDAPALADSVLLILDLALVPAYRPLDILYKLRSSGTARSLPVLVVTSEKNELYRSMAHALGVEAYLELPAEGSAILAEAERLIAAFTARAGEDSPLSDATSAAQKYIARALEAEKLLAEKEKEIEQLVRVRDSIFELSRQELLEARADAERSLEEKLAALKEKSDLQMAFGKYISPDVLNQLIQSNGLHSLSGEKKDISIMFADLRGFTSLAEGLDAEDVVALLNEFFTDLTQIIITHTGFIDKYIGDCIMAIFGAPAPLSQHHHLALLAAVKMQDRFRQLRSIWRERYNRDIGMGIGLNSGEAVVGTIGSFQKISYTAIGDTVNIASRMEDISAEGEILFPLSVRERIRDSFLKRYTLRVVERGEATVKGKTGLLAIFNLERIPS